MDFVKRVCLVFIVSWVLGMPRLAACSMVEIMVAFAPDHHSEEVVKAMLKFSPHVGKFEEILAETEVPGRVSLSLPEGSWQLSLVADGFWAESRVVDVSDGQEPLDLKLVRAGSITGIIKVPHRESPPETLSIRLQTTESEERAQRTQECFVEDKGYFSCPLPAGSLDLRLSADGYIAHYLWDIQVPWQEQKNLGRFSLRPGASVIGWISLSDGQGDLDQSSVEVLPLLGGMPDRWREEKRHQSKALKANVNSRGFYQIADIPPGNYRLAVHHPRLSSTTVSPVLVGEGDEHEIDSIELQPKAALEVEVTPKTDPFGRRWEVELQHQGADPSTRDLAAKGAADATVGTWRRSALDRGIYQLVVRDSKGYRWLSEEIDLDSDELFYPADLPLTRFEVRFVLDDEPVAGGDVEFVSVEHGSKVGRNTDEEGRVYLFLPKDHLWNVKIRQPQQGVSARFEKIKVPKRKAGDRWPKLELEIPDTSILGRVIHADGQPLTKPALVTVSGEQGSIWVETNEDSSFQVRGSKPGSVRLQASLESGDDILRSNVVHVEAAEGSPLGPLDLVLQKEMVLSGFVYSSSGQGVPGTRVIATLGAAAAGTSTHLRDAYTDVEGVFEIRLPEALTSVQLALFPPGFAATQQRVQLPLEESLLIPVDEEAGQVTISFENPPEDYDERRLKWGVWLSKDSLFVGSTHVLTPWASLHGVEQTRDRLLIPMAAPGSYTACFELGIPPGTPIPEALMIRCTSGYLGVGDDLHLKIPITAFAAGG